MFLKKKTYLRYQWDNEAKLAKEVQVKVRSIKPYKGGKFGLRIHDRNAFILSRNTYQLQGEVPSTGERLIFLAPCHILEPFSSGQTLELKVAQEGHCFEITTLS